MHLPQWPAPIAIFLLSMGLGTSTSRTGSLLAAIVMHGTFNGFNTVLMLMAAIDHQLQPHVATAHQHSAIWVLLDLHGSRHMVLVRTGPAWRCRPGYLAPWRGIRSERSI